jgi:hypothetical protein
VRHEEIVEYEAQLLNGRNIDLAFAPNDRDACWIAPPDSYLQAAHRAMISLRRRQTEGQDRSNPAGGRA